MTQNKALEALEFIEMAYVATTQREAIPAGRDKPHNELVKGGTKAVAHRVEIVRAALTQLDYQKQGEMTDKEVCLSNDAIKAMVIIDDIFYYACPKWVTMCKEPTISNKDMHLIRTVITQHAAYIEGSEIAYASLIEHKQELQAKLDDLDRNYQASLRQIRSQAKDNNRLRKYLKEIGRPLDRNVKGFNLEDAQGLAQEAQKGGA